MYSKIAISEVFPDTEHGGAKSVTIILFDERGREQLRIPNISGRIFPKDITKGKEVIFTKPGNIFSITQK